MQDYENKVKKCIHDNVFSKSGETYLDLSLQEDSIYSELNSIGKYLCTKYIKGCSSFYLIDSCRVQAVAIHEYQTVLVFKRMLELIFRTSAMMVGAERRLNEPDATFYEPWHNNMNSWINGGEFEWENDQYWWLHDDTHRKMFDMLVEGMFVFLVLHEIGHLHNLHGKRRRDTDEEKSSPMEHIILIHKAVAESDDEEMDEAENLDRHTCEIIADTYAFQFMLSELKEHFFSESEYVEVDTRALSALNLGVCLYITASFFWVLSYKHPMKNDTQNDDYPSHAFRLVSIEAASLEHKVCQFDDSLTHSGLELGMKSYIEKLNCAAGNDEFVNWRLSMNFPANQAHYEKICANTSNWSNFMFGVRDEDWLKK